MHGGRGWPLLVNGLSHSRSEVSAQLEDHGELDGRSAYYHLNGCLAERLQQASPFHAKEVASSSRLWC
jgi:hypothetical protein